ncbi:MAG: hypothetical protein ACOZF0_10015 [Thermodesulfobacteriota bacterium]
MQLSGKLVVILVVMSLMPVTMGCAAHKRAKIARQAQSDMIGMTKAELLACAGVPVRSERLENMEFMTYSSGGDSHGMFHRVRRYCEVTFTLRDGRVEKIAYNGNTGGYFTEDEQCAYALKSCLQAE